MGARRLAAVVAAAMVVASAVVGSPAGADPACPGGYVALTFDDGPRRGVTEHVLDVLRAREVLATFFVTGYGVDRSPDLALRAAVEGHAFGNHTWGHENLTALSDAGIRDTLARVGARLAAAGVRPPVVMRPPGGYIDARVDAVVRAAGYVPLLWTIDPQDWRGISADQVAGRVLSQLHPGAVILLHDGAPGAANTVGALPAIIDGTRQRGYCFGVLDDRGAVAAILAAPPRSVQVLAGGDRFQTAVAASRYGWPWGALTAVLASGERYPDALTAAVLSGTVGGPLLLTPEHRVHDAVLTELRRLRPRRVYTVGAVGDEVDNAVRAEGFLTERIRGVDRYETAQLLALRAGQLGAETSTVLVASGDGFPDALAAGQLAAGLRHPVLLASAQDDPARLADRVAAVGAERTWVVGGTAVLPEAAVAGLPGLERLAGPDRVATTAAVADRAVALGLTGPPLLAGGDDFADALAAATLAGERRSPMLVTARAPLSPLVLSWLAAQGSGTHVIAVGGPAAISPTALCQLRAGFSHSFLCW
ncbi:MAG TPA: cell wall-binding repeat-containing protein, partial [Egibacteraceae bacterium]|nr:cell wall-binding repeat-containing protein [Egibacteraceae bacterium]